MIFQRYKYNTLFLKILKHFFIIIGMNYYHYNLQLEASTIEPTTGTTSTASDTKAANLAALTALHRFFFSAFFFSCFCHFY